MSLPVLHYALLALFFLGRCDCTLNAIYGLAGAPLEVSEDLNELDPRIMPPQTPPSSLRAANQSFFISLNVMVVVIFLFIMLAWYVKAKYPRYSPSIARPPLWVWGALGALYVLYTIGLFEEFFNLAIKVDHSGKVSVLHLSETVIGMTSLLKVNESVTGAILFVVCVMLLPLAWLVLMLVGELWRTNDNPGKEKISATCIDVAPLINKCGSTSMFACIFSVLLVTSVDTKGMSLAACWGSGFTYMLFLYIGSLSLHLFMKGEADTRVALHEPLLLRWLGKVGTLVFALVLATFFLLFLALGVALPCLGIGLATDTIHALAIEHELDAILAPLLPKVNATVWDNTEYWARSDINLVSLTAKALDMVFYGGQANAFFVVLLLGFFVFFLSLADMYHIVAASYKMYRSHRNPDLNEVGGEYTWRSRVLMQLEMLDACVGGMIFVILAGSTFRERGLEIFFMPGVLFVALAEVIHYLAHYFVVPAVEHAQALKTNEFLHSVCSGCYTARSFLSSQTPKSSART